MTSLPFAHHYKPEPIWWERSPLSVEPEPTLPAKADVVVIGSGYTGLCAAIQTVRGGRHTVVIEANAIGSGCSSRNGGQAHSSSNVGDVASESTKRPDSSSNIGWVARGSTKRPDSSSNIGYVASRADGRGQQRDASG